MIRLRSRGSDGAGRGASGLLARATVVLALAGCEARPIADDSRCVNWREDVAPLLVGSTLKPGPCLDCHQGPTPQGKYRVATYNEAIAVGADGKPVAVSGRADSRLLRVLDPATADAAHKVSAETFATVKRWVVDCRLSYFESTIHGTGVLDPANDPEFHGNVVRRLGWDFGACSECHGRDFAGGKSGVSCKTCHGDGPTACNTCHGQPPATKAHPKHAATNEVKRALDCVECHVKPKFYWDVGHLFNADGTAIADPKATVTLGAMAGLSLHPEKRLNTPSWDPMARRCANVYCHGAAFADTKATNIAPGWDLEKQAECGACHGLPPSDHASDDCGGCHRKVAKGKGATATITDVSRHVDGKISLGDETGTCFSCHGNASLPNNGPPPALDGSTEPSAMGVGVHQSHLSAKHGLGVPVACDACHLVPKEVSSRGHIDTELPAEVFPADATFKSLATADKAMPVWDRAKGTCSGVYCHGGGDGLKDEPAAIVRAPTWTDAGKAATCGVGCHGNPPIDTYHKPTMKLTDCASCHPRTVDPTGKIIVTGTTGALSSRHINGVIDVP